jgi:iron complex transport system permease protein
MVPHMGRALFGVRTLPPLAGAALVGAAFLAVCDGLARAVHPPTELPVGVVTNILGAAFFFYLLATRRVARGTARS